MSLIVRPILQQIIRSLFTAIFTLFSFFAYAATPVETPGFWRPWKTPYPPSSEIYKCGGSKQAFVAMEDKLKKVRGVLEKLPAIANPVGYEVSAEMHEIDYDCTYYVPSKNGVGIDMRYDNTRPISATLSFFPFAYLEYKGKIIPNHEAQPLYFRFNDLKINDLQHLTGFLLEPVLLGEVFGLEAWQFQVWGDCLFQPGRCESEKMHRAELILRNQNRSLWKPAPLADVYSLLIAHYRDAVPTLENSLAKELSSVQRGDAEDENLRIGTRHNAAEKAAKAKMSVEAWLEKQERIIRGLAARRLRDAESSSADLQKLRALIGSLEAKLEDIKKTTPDAVTYMCEAPSLAGVRVQNDSPTIYRPTRGPGCWPVVTVDKNYFDKKLPKSALQLLRVQGYEECKPSGNPGVGNCNADEKLLSGIDWDTVRALMNK